MKIIKCLLINCIGIYYALTMPFENAYTIIIYKLAHHYYKYTSIIDYIMRMDTIQMIEPYKLQIKYT